MRRERQEGGGNKREFWGRERQKGETTRESYGGERDIRGIQSSGGKRDTRGRQYERVAHSASYLKNN